MLRESLRMSLSNILGNKLRSLLTTLGIVIGVMAIIALVTIMQSATSEVSAQFESLGAGKLTVQASGTPLKRGLNANDLAAVEALEGVDGISPPRCPRKCTPLMATPWCRTCWSRATALPIFAGSPTPWPGAAR